MERGREPPSSSPDASRRSAIERRVEEIGTDLLDRARRRRAGVFSSRFWSDKLMSWAMKDPGFKVQLFRFVDVFPMLRTSRQVYDYLVDYLGRLGDSLPGWMRLGMKAGGLAKGVLTKTIANRITAMAGNFIAGADAVSALPVLRKRWKKGIAFSIDLLGEACVSHREAREYQRRYLDLIETLPRESGAWPAEARLESDHLGPVPRANVSIKISSLDARADPIDFDGSIGRLTEALRPILEAASRHGVLVNFDMEHHALKDLTLELFERCCEAIDFPAGLALQSYLRSGEDDARRIIAWAKRTGRQVTVRLIKGAYWDYELIHAEQMGWPIPVWTEKSDTDACFERMAGLFVASMPRRADEGGVKLALGSHNVRSIAYTLALLDQHGLPESALELQMLRGMADQLKTAVLEQGLRLREYVPVGEMIPGMAYLVRRLLENTSNQSWLRAGFSDDLPDGQLLASPHEAQGASHVPLDCTVGGGEHHRLSPAVEGLGDGRPMVNEPPRDFSDREARDRFAEAILAARLPEVGRQATADDAEAAVGRAVAAVASWRGAAPLERSGIVVRAAAMMRDRRDELAGVMIREAGKTWREADADVCEAIDFCEYYARSAVGLFNPQRLGRFVGELNETWYQPRGVAAVISPWNFPLAICAGMTTAALVTGNTAIVKPSTQTPGIARLMCDVLHQAGVPPDALQLLPGPGSVVGAALVRNPQVALIAFTGSKEVGLDVLRAAGQTHEEQGFLKKVVCELGGKNAVIVDESADLDEAVLGVRNSAFGYSGQKCSACSRAIVVDAVYEAFLRRLVESTRSLVIGDPADPATDVGPVIDEGAARKIREYLEVGRREGTIELACDVPEGLEEKVGKPYIGPHVFSGIGPDHRLANEEVFGPVLSVTRAGDFHEALDLANATAYKLTGGVYSRKPSHLELARREFRVGNLYLNRGITGALVGRQPFGGFGLSGGGTKAGGADYLLHFVEPRACCENTMRHGFAPGLM
ncbi:MAG: proline dehydrogenase family protein [Planctomycetota bacterium]|jgi:RHH-type proline utilization regulon transcriptional repressor/proline dehydrogenase/delta 1-pyrroline-5-carboxylate dehydrogenase